MDNLISRQAAIDSINGVMADYIPFLYGKYEKIPLDIAMAIIKLPSVQPEAKVLEKIRADIEKVVWEDVIISLDGTDETRIPRLDPDDVFEIIDKYAEESEGKECGC